MAELGRTADEYQLALKKLLPKGPAWELDDSSFFIKMLQLASLEFARIDADIIRLINESDPRTAEVTLSDWFHQWGIPDECIRLYGEDDITTYVQALIAKISTQGLTFIELLKILATSLGYSGVELGNYEPFTVDSTVDQRLYSEDWIYFVRMITVDKVPVRELTVDSTVDKALAEWGNQFWECMVKSLAPAHLSLIFQYGED